MEFIKPKKQISIQVLTQLNRLKNNSKKNAVRGLLSQGIINNSDINKIRKNSTPQDLMKIAAILNGPYGLMNKSGNPEKRKNQHIYTVHFIENLPLLDEIYFTAGYINSWKDHSIDIAHRITSLSFSENEQDFLRNLLDIAINYGSSIFLSRKLAKTIINKTNNNESSSLIQEIEEITDHNNSQGLVFSAIENISADISIFRSAERKINSYSDEILKDFRRSIALHNTIPTPVSEQDCSGFLLRSTSSSLVDTIHSIMILLNLEETYPHTVDILRSIIDPEILSEIDKSLEIIEKNLNIQKLIKKTSQESNSTLTLYKMAFHSLESKSCASYRNSIDKVVGLRSINKHSPKNQKIHITRPELKQEILKKDNEITLTESGIEIRIDHFYRTYLFLLFIESKYNITNINEEEIKFIFENTVELELLITELEMEMIYATSSEQSKEIITILTLALHRKKTISDDIDFIFRRRMADLILHNYNGSLISFINSFIDEHPQIASYLAASLDEITLQKMYGLISNAEEALERRHDILKKLGESLENINYIIEADAIQTRKKVAKSKKYFDESRMYVDSMAFSKWLSNNPTVYAELYQSALSPDQDYIHSYLQTDNQLILFIKKQRNYLIEKIAEDAFKEFCLNPEFGIESYLSRRIRHNTLEGVMRDKVEDVILKPEYRALISSKAAKRNIESWKNNYSNNIIEKLRSEKLQFKTNNSLFSYKLNTNCSITKSNIKELITSLNVPGSRDILNELVINFCWKQISPQLENAAQYIKTTLLQEASKAIDQIFNGMSPIEKQLRADLLNATNEAFRKVAGWFQVPQTGFISTSIRDLTHIILEDINSENRTVEINGSCSDTIFTGISVHRLYDCLSVILQNAIKHSKKQSKVEILTEPQLSTNDNTLQLIKVTIISNSPPETFENSRERISRAMASPINLSAMVKEGYSGINKAKVITNLSGSGNHTLIFESNDKTKEIRISFQIYMEKANVNQPNTN